jgi:hypothetical protein
MLTQAFLGASNTHSGTILPYATTTIKSSSNFFNILKKSTFSFNFLGCSTFMLFSLANTFTAVGVNIFFLHTGLSG